MTALYDAIGKTINTMDIMLKATKKRKSKNIMVIITDGHENSSIEFGSDQTQNLINQKKKEDWQFVFIGADQDAIKAGQSVGVTYGNSLGYASCHNISMFATLSKRMVEYRNSSYEETIGSDYTFFKEEDRGKEEEKEQ